MVSVSVTGTASPIFRAFICVLALGSLTLGASACDVECVEEPGATQDHRNVGVPDTIDDICDGSDVIEEIEEIPLIASCRGQCGATDVGGCDCDAGCEERGTCCSDFSLLGGQPSCAGYCTGHNAVWDCYCDLEACLELGDCCADAVEICGEF